MRGKSHKICFWCFLVPALVALSSPVLAQEPFKYEKTAFSSINDAAQMDIDLEDPRAAGIKFRRFTKGMRVRGWQVSERVYFGQARVANKWGLGFVYSNGDMLYGINHRGIEITRQF